MIKEPCIFLPGTLCDERIWLNIWRQLNTQERYYVPLQWAENLEQMLALTSDRVQQCNKRVHLIGYSMGGYIASLYALKHKDKVASLTLISYDPYGLSKLETQARQLVVKMLKHNPTLNLGQKRLANYFTSDELQQQDLSALVVDMEEDLGIQTLVNQIKATTPRTDLVNKLADVNFPIYCLVGSEDKIANPSNIKTFANNHEHVKSLVFASTSHMIPITRPNELAKNIEEFIEGKSR